MFVFFVVMVYGMFLKLMLIVVGWFVLGVNLMLFVRMFLIVLVGGVTRVGVFLAIVPTVSKIMVKEMLIVVG